MLTGFPSKINETCIVVSRSVIDSKGSPFSDKKKKKVDEIHHCEKLGLIEQKTSNYGAEMLKKKFSDQKEFLEKKYGQNKYCTVGYCVVLAERLSEKTQRELGVNMQHELYFKHHHNKEKLEISKCPVYFVKG